MSYTKTYTKKWVLVFSFYGNVVKRGCYFTNKVCLVLYRDSNMKMTVFYRLTDGEHLREFKEDLANVKRAIPEMFNYMRHDKNPKSSNSIESFFRTRHGAQLEHKMVAIGEIWVDTST